KVLYHFHSLYELKNCDLRSFASFS
ncbi:hypothetical protein MG5_05520, partial [Candida albicans P57072]